MYTIEYLDNVIDDDIPALPATMKQLIKKAIEERLTLDPIDLGKPLRYALRGHRRLRVGYYRVIYRIEQEQRIVLIVAIKHRKNVYNDLYFYLG